MTPRTRRRSTTANLEFYLYLQYQLCQCQHQQFWDQTYSKMKDHRRLHQIWIGLAPETMDLLQIHEPIKIVKYDRKRYGIELQHHQ